MKKIILAGALFLGVILVSGCAQKNMDNSSSKDSSKESPRKSLADTIASGESLKCTIQDELGSYTLFTKDGKLRIEGVEYPVTNEGEENKIGTMINDRTFIYMWNGDSGIRMTPEDDEDFSESSGINSLINVEDWSRWVEEKDVVEAPYDCQMTELDDTEFVPPQKVVFKSLSQLSSKENQSVGEESPLRARD